jgi:outer membrane protein
MRNLLIVLALSFLAISAHAEIVIGQVNMQKIVTSINQGKKVRDVIKKKFDKMQAEIKKEEDSIKGLQQKFQKQSAVMSAQAKQKKGQEIQKKIMALQQKTMTYQKQIQQMEQQKMAPILKKLKAVIDTVSKGSKVDLTVEGGAAPIIYAKKTIDLSDKVISAYNKKFK